MTATQLLGTQTLHPSESVAVICLFDVRCCYVADRATPLRARLAAGGVIALVRNLCGSTYSEVSDWFYLNNAVHSVWAVSSLVQAGSCRLPKLGTT